MLGTVATVGTLRGFIGKYAGFSECHQSANGTLDRGQESAFDRFRKLACKIEHSRRMVQEVKEQCEMWSTEVKARNQDEL